MDLITALRRKYRTPEEVLAKLGIDAKLLDEEDDNMPRHRLAHDQSPQLDNCLASFKSMLSQLDDAERAEFAEQIMQLLDTEPADPPLAITSRGAEDRTRRRIAADAAQRYRAPSSADARGFNARFPNATRIGIA